MKCHFVLRLPQDLHDMSTERQRQRGEKTNNNIMIILCFFFVLHQIIEIRNQKFAVILLAFQASLSPMGTNFSKQLR